MKYNRSFVVKDHAYCIEWPIRHRFICQAYTKENNYEVYRVHSVA